MHTLEHDRIGLTVDERARLHELTDPAPGHNCAGGRALLRLCCASERCIQRVITSDGETADLRRVGNGLHLRCATLPSPDADLSIYEKEAGS